MKELAFSEHYGRSKMVVTRLTLLASVLLLMSFVVLVGNAQVSVADCAKGFIEITPKISACGFTLTRSGKLTQEGQVLVDPLISSYVEGANGTKPNIAGKVVLFPVSSSGRFRVLQVCDGPDTRAMCATVFVFDKRTAQLHPADAGHYGPERWQSWSSDERHVVLVDRSEGAGWLHIIDPTNGKTRDFPNPRSNENWTVQPETLRWTSSNSFTIRVKPCERCHTARRRIRF